MLSGDKIDREKTPTLKSKRSTRVSGKLTAELYEDTVSSLCAQCGDPITSYKVTIYNYCSLFIRETPSLLFYTITQS